MQSRLSGGGEEAEEEEEEEVVVKSARSQSGLFSYHFHWFIAFWLLECEIIYPRPLLNVLLQLVPVPSTTQPLCSVIYGNVVRCL